ncbi:MAG: hypothetical protein RR840_00965 [Clostridium sp.]
MHNHSGANTCCTCVPGIRYALQSVKECICLSKEDPTLSVVIKITKVSGIVDTITLTYTNLNLLKICSDALIFNSSLVIPLEEISKIQILTSTVTNQGFKNCLKAKLSNPNPSCMALAVDDNGRGSGRGKSSNNSTNNCNTGLSCFLNENRDTLTTVQYDGCGSNTQVIQEVEAVTKTDVVNNVVFDTTSTNVPSNIKLTTETTNVVNSVVTTPVNVLSSAQSTPKSVVTSVTSRTGEALIALSATPQMVVENIKLDPKMDVVTNVTLSTSPVCGPLTTQDLNVITALTLQAIPNVATALTTLTAPFLTGLGNPTTATVITGYPNLTTVQVLSPGNANATVLTDITTATAVESLAVDMPSIASQDGRVGTLQVIIPANTFGAGVPATDTPFDVVVGNSTNPVSLAAPTTIDVLPAADTVLTVTGTPALKTVSDVLGNPNLVTVIQSLGTPSTANAVTGYPNPTIANAITTVNNTPVTINNPSTPTTTAIKAITTAPTTVNAGTSLNVTKVPLRPLNVDSPYSRIQVSQVGSPVTSRFVYNVSSTSETISTIGVVTPTTVNSVQSVTDTSVINKASVDSTPTSVLNSATLGQTKTSVVKDVTLSDVSVISVTPETVNGHVIGVFGGIMTLESTSGDLTVYSLCHIVSATSLPPNPPK